MLSIGSVICKLNNSTRMRTTAGPGGYSQKNLVGVCGTVRFSLRPDLLLRRDTPEGRGILAGYYGFNANVF